MRFKIDWASLIVGRKLTIFALFQFVFGGNFQVQVPRGLIFGGFFALRVLGGLIFGGTLWRGFFRNFTVCHGVFTDRLIFRYILEHFLTRK